MGTSWDFRQRAGVALAVVAVATGLAACGTKDGDVAGQRFTVLAETDTASQPPTELEGTDAFAPGSLRELGEFEQHRYYAARDRTAPQSSVCLISVDTLSETWGSACGAVTNANADPVVTLGQGSTRQAGLVSDDADTQVLTDNGWEAVSENLWVVP